MQRGSGYWRSSESLNEGAAYSSRARELTRPPRSPTMMSLGAAVGTSASVQAAKFEHRDLAGCGSSYQL